MRRRWWMALAVAAMIGVVGLQFWQIFKIRKDLDDLAWSVAVNGRDDDSVITPDVGTIQFLKKGGYSIQLNAANYMTNGLSLQGLIGNPTNLWVTNLSLKFSATKNLYEYYRDDFKWDQFAFFFGPQSIGVAQCSPITTLAPGSVRPFEVTIPNVKQTKEGIRIVVEFTGERYSYSP